MHGELYILKLPYNNCECNTFNSVSYNPLQCILYAPKSQKDPQILKQRDMRTLFLLNTVSILEPVMGLSELQTGF